MEDKGVSLIILFNFLKIILFIISLKKVQSNKNHFQIKLKIEVIWWNESKTLENDFNLTKGASKHSKKNYLIQSTNNGLFLFSLFEWLGLATTLTNSDIYCRYIDVTELHI